MNNTAKILGFITGTIMLCVALFAGLAHSKGGGGSVSVRGYTTKSGTYVAPHMRSAPDGNVWNNWSTKGNVNPYTGKEGTKNPYPGTSTVPALGISVTPQPVGIVIPNMLGENPIIITHPVNKPAYLASIGDSFQF